MYLYKCKVSPESLMLACIHKPLRLAINHVASGRIAQLVTCLAIDASLTANPGVASLIPAPYFRGD